MALCAVCKQEIKEGESSTTTPQGEVHQGVCHQHLMEMTMTESEGSLESVELLV